jgi:outer membrane protein TolC
VKSSPIQQVRFQTPAPDTTAPSSFLPCPAQPFAGAEELTPEMVVEQVLARNPTVAQMIAAWQAASARYPQVTSLDDPNFGFTMAPASIGSNAVEFGYRLEVTQKYPFPGKRALRGENAAAEASAAGREVDDIRLQLVESARNAFYEYFLVFRAIAVNEQNLDLLKTARKSAETRITTGKASQQEVLQIDVEIGRQRERGVTLERMRKVAAARINTLMHLLPDTPLPPAPVRLASPGELPPVEALRAAAVARRPDLQAVADRVAAEQAQVALARREFFPDFEVGAMYDTIMGNGPARDLAPQVMLRMNLPVRRGRRFAALAEVEAKVAQRQAEFTYLTDQINFQVQEAYERVAESDRLVRLYQGTILPKAQDNVNAAQPAYATGMIPLLSLLEAQRNLVMLRDRYYEVFADYFRRRAALERAVGGPLTQTGADGDPHAPAGSPGCGRLGFSELSAPK